MSAGVNNKILVREFFEEAWVKGNVAAVDEFMAPDYVEHPRPPHPTAWHRGLEDGPRRYLRRR